MNSNKHRIFCATEFTDGDIEISTAYSAIIKFNEIKNDDYCLICLENYNNTSLIYKLFCGHCFDCKCICKWFSVSDSCPICRKKLFSVIKPINFYFFNIYLFI